MAQAWHILLKRIKCLDTQAMNISGYINYKGVDEVAVIYAACDWRNASNPYIKVGYIGPYEMSSGQVEYPRHTIWKNPFNILESAFFVQAVERDYSDRSAVSASIKAEMLGSLKYSLKTGRSRTDTLYYLKKNFTEGRKKAYRDEVDDDDAIGSLRRIVIYRADKEKIYGGQSFVTYNKKTTGDGASYYWTYIMQKA